MAASLMSAINGYDTGPGVVPWFDAVRTGQVGIVTIERSGVERTIRRVSFVALKILPSHSRLTGGICLGADVEAARSYES